MREYISYSNTSRKPMISYHKEIYSPNDRTAVQWTLGFLQGEEIKGTRINLI
jgi:hypothetical protein